MPSCIQQTIIFSFGFSHADISNQLVVMKYVHPLFGKLYLQNKLEVTILWHEHEYVKGNKCVYKKNYIPTVIELDLMLLN